MSTTNDSSLGVNITITPPTEAEVAAGERVLADAHSQPCDGYWRSLAEAVLEAAKDAQLKAVLASIDAEIDVCESALTKLRTEDPPVSLIADVLSSDDRQTVRVCRHCGIGAPEAAAMNEPRCSESGGFHSYVDTPVSRPLPDLLETGHGR